ncbi:MAG: tRNA (adenosine(37)-N6)-threonylcarbamoyltransferase complex ATPase subunit type 1 TsaE [Solirubrobacterales bacterium]
MSATDMVITTSAEETEQLGMRIAAELEPGDLILLNGEVGAGKSTLIRSAMRSLGVRGAIPSPTFTIGRTYTGDLPVSHMDFHRIGSIEAEDPGLLSEYFGPDRIVFIEWPGDDETVLALYANRVRTISITHAGGDSRRVEIGPVRLSPQ